MRMFRALDIVENSLAVSAFAVVSVVAFANVLSRYVFNASLAFTSELTVNLAVLLTMVGAAIGLREGSHLGFTLIKDTVTGRKHQLLVLIGGLAIVLFYLALFKFGLDMSVQQFERQRTTPALGLPMWLLSAALPFGAVLGIIRTIQVTVSGVKESPVKSATNEAEV